MSIASSTFVTDGYYADPTPFSLSSNTVPIVNLWETTDQDMVDASDSFATNTLDADNYDSVIAAALAAADMDIADCMADFTVWN